MNGKKDIELGIYDIYGFVIQLKARRIKSSLKSMGISKFQMLRIK